MTGYTDEAFAKALDKVEELLADLYGIETVAEEIRRYAHSPDGAGDEAFKTTTHINLPAQQPFTVYPSLPVADRDYQTWADDAFEVGRLKAAATSAWLKHVAGHYYLVDAEALTTSAQHQSKELHALGVEVDDMVAEVSSTLAVRWEGDAKEQFFEWFPMANTVVLALLFYADTAQLVAGAAGAAIRATQDALMSRAEEAVKSLEAAVAAWRDDYDVFPFPPGSGMKFKEIGIAISEAMDEYTSQVPGGEVIANQLTKKSLKQFPVARYVTTGYQIVTTLEVNDKDPETPTTADNLRTAIEGEIRDIAREGDLALAKLDDAIAEHARAVASDPLLVLARLPRTPEGTYDPT
ncbi:hypothetical protein [Nocardioides marmotae]|uniref:Uncharacterized protein n=1 Tax=Nocardioides marmotae TaxID=2663857 RepID=A0A6I3JBG1_9ACTN|nr:hypothetical protein [Nocardioides marmotae]MCR6031845.1 hypothetical protein [Gordonia jinghuaiqii]MBC9732209.1 hypothetical protein [Nocardioides marmotae]MTB83331.1 hypothetical protein [Nocardioides marmotae]MTB95486.1 hypothetical protein [Nocardioides marmotae]QKE00918.1 hypothetical protein HPC71_07420 [Nocardioides marmotae]